MFQDCLALFVSALVVKLFLQPCLIKSKPSDNVHLRYDGTSMIVT